MPPAETWNPAAPEDYKVYRFVVVMDNPHLERDDRGQPVAYRKSNEDTHPRIRTNAFLALRLELYEQLFTASPGKSEQEIMTHVMHKAWQDAVCDEGDVIEFIGEEPEEFTIQFILQMMHRRMLRGIVVDSIGVYPA